MLAVQREIATDVAAALAFKFGDGDAVRGTTASIAAYDSVYWIKNAIERAGSSKPEHLRSALETTNNLHLIHLNLTMTSSHDPLNKGAVIMKAVNGKSVFVKKVKP